MLINDARTTSIERPYLHQAVTSITGTCKYPEGGRSVKVQL